MIQTWKWSAQMVTPPSHLEEESRGKMVDSSSCSDSHFSLAHVTELQVQRELLACEKWLFQSLVVHRMRDGICLQGVVQGNDLADATEICDLAREVAGVSNVINHLVLQQLEAANIPPKG
jgi:hypothetical protein